MAHEPGDAYDCPACGGTHTVESGKGLEVPGSTEGLEPGVYVRCPEVGAFDPERGPAGDDAGGGADPGDGDDWP